MTRPSKGKINIDIKDPVPDWEPYRQPIAGFSAIEPFGGPIETPNINRIVQRGLTYTNFHTILLDSIMGGEEGPHYQLGRLRLDPPIPALMQVTVMASVS